jgi:hypothetical protein
MSAPARKALGSVLILIFLIAYIALATMAGEWVLQFGMLAGGLFFAIAGVAWVFPLRPLFKWMNRAT